MLSPSSAHLESEEPLVASRRSGHFVAVMRLERSVLSELAQSFGIAVSALTALMLVEIIYEAVLQGLALGSLIKFIPILIPYTLPWTIPAAFVAACLMTYSRMAGSNELTVVRASGIHVWRPLAPAAMMAMFLCAVCGVLNHHLVPNVAFFQYSLGKSASASELVAAIRAADPLEPVIEIGKKYKVYMGDLRDDDTFRDITIVSTEPLGAAAKDSPGRQVSYLRAPKGRYEHFDDRSELVFYLEADLTLATPKAPDAGYGTMHNVEHGAGQYDFEKALFKECVYRIKLKSMADMNFLPQRGKHMTSAQLLRKIVRHEETVDAGRRQAPKAAGMTESELAHARKKYKKWQDEPRHWRTEIHKRSALSLAPLLLGAIAVPIGVMMRRGHRLAAFGLAVAIIFVYYALLAGGWKLGSSGMLPPAVAMWGVSAAVAACGVGLMRQMFKR
jgi:lipopolysaccharide export system permease protein